MKRYLTLIAVAALAVSVVLPAAIFVKGDSFAVEQSATASQLHSQVTDDSQTLGAGGGPTTPVARDQFTVEILKPTIESGATFTPIAGMLTMWPCAANVNDGYGPREGGFHYGLDIMCPLGTPEVAPAPGVVEVVKADTGGWGTHVIINHGNGIQTLYAHMIAGSPTVVVGQVVNTGDLLGYAGDTGNTTAPHLHFELWANGERVDPRPWLP